MSTPRFTSQSPKTSESMKSNPGLQRGLAKCHSKEWNVKEVDFIGEHYNFDSHYKVRKSKEQGIYRTAPIAKRVNDPDFGKYLEKLYTCKICREQSKKVEALQRELQDIKLGKQYGKPPNCIDDLEEMRGKTMKSKVEKSLESRRNDLNKKITELQGANRDLENQNKYYLKENLRVKQDLEKEIYVYKAMIRQLQDEKELLKKECNKKIFAGKKEDEKLFFKQAVVRKFKEESAERGIIDYHPTESDSSLSLTEVEHNKFISELCEKNEIINNLERNVPYVKAGIIEQVKLEISQKFDQDCSVLRNEIKEKLQKIKELERINEEKEKKILPNRKKSS